jgi:hypothetical protein
MIKVKITKASIEHTKEIFGVEPYRITSHPRSKEAMAKDLSSKRMRIANEIANNLIFSEEVVASGVFSNKPKKKSRKDA